MAGWPASRPDRLAGVWVLYHFFNIFILFICLIGNHSFCLVKTIKAMIL